MNNKQMKEKLVEVIIKRLEDPKGCLGLYQTQIGPIAVWLADAILDTLEVKLPRRKYVIPDDKMCKEDTIGSTWTQDVFDNLYARSHNRAIDKILELEEEKSLEGKLKEQLELIIKEYGKKEFGFNIYEHHTDSIATTIANQLRLDREKIRIFGRHNLEEVFKRRSSYPNGQHYINLVGLHEELNDILSDALASQPLKIITINKGE